MQMQSYMHKHFILLMYDTQHSTRYLHNVITTVDTQVVVACAQLQDVKCLL